MHLLLLILDLTPQDARFACITPYGCVGSHNLSKSFHPPPQALEVNVKLAHSRPTRACVVWIPYSYASVSNSIHKDNGPFQLEQNSVSAHAEAILVFPCGES